MFKSKREKEEAKKERPVADIYLDDIKTKGGMGWSYDRKQRLFTINSDTELTISGKSVRYNRILVKPGVTAAITLHDTEIDLTTSLSTGILARLLGKAGPKKKRRKKGDPEDIGYCALDMTDATLILKLKGTNKLISQRDRAGVELSAKSDESPGSKLEILGEYTEDGKEKYGGLLASSIHGAGIGGRKGRSNGEVSVNSGNLGCVSLYGAGIGGGSNGPGGIIRILGGYICAITTDGAGIGGGSGGFGGDIEITGGKIEAKSQSGAGIGGGMNGFGGTITIGGGDTIVNPNIAMAMENIAINPFKKEKGSKKNKTDTRSRFSKQLSRFKNKEETEIPEPTLGEENGDISADSEEHAPNRRDMSIKIECKSIGGAGIGGGRGSPGKIIRILPSKTNAEQYVSCQSQSGAGIGGGFEGMSGTISLDGGYVISNSVDGAGIGGGARSRGELIRISNGSYQCYSQCGAGIGGGYCGGCAEVDLSNSSVIARSIYGNATGGGQNGSGSNGQLQIKDAILLAHSVHTNDTGGIIAIEKGILAGKDGIQEWEDGDTGLIQVYKDLSIPRDWEFKIPEGKTLEVSPDVWFMVWGSMDSKSGEIWNSGLVMTMGNGRLIGKIIQKKEEGVGEDGSDILPKSNNQDDAE